MNYKILIIEDDQDINLMLEDFFTKEGYEVETSFNGEEGVKKARKFEPDIILLDVMMPIMDGYEALSKIRSISNVPVIMLTAKGQQMDKIKGFNKGCDDYVVKPFDLIELNLRMKAILRRGNVKSDNLIYKDLEINEREFKVLKAGEEIKLTKKEFKILLLLLKNKDRIFSTKAIYENVWGEEYMDNDNSLLTHIKNLRDKIGDRVKNGEYIKTIWGVGYKIEKDD